MIANRFNPRSLRKACETIVAATDLEEGGNKIDLERIGHNIAHRYNQIFNLDRGHHGQYHPIGTLTMELRSLLRRARKSIDYRYRETSTPHAPPAIECNHYGSCHCTEYGTAFHNEGLDYFTSMCVDDDDMPWAGSEEWKEAVFPQVDIAPASPEWLKVVGL